MAYPLVHAHWRSAHFVEWGRGRNTSSGRRSLTRPARRGIRVACREQRGPRHGRRRSARCPIGPSGWRVTSTIQVATRCRSVGEARLTRDAGGREIRASVTPTSDWQARDQTGGAGSYWIPRRTSLARSCPARRCTRWSAMSIPAEIPAEVTTSPSSTKRSSGRI